MFGRKKEAPLRKKRPNAAGGLSQYGLMDMDMAIDPMGGADDDDDDDDLEAELLALTSGKAPARPKRGGAPPAKTVNLDSMIAASMRDIPSDEELSGDDDDPDLLNELSALNEDEEEDSVPSAANVPPPKSSSTSLLSLLNERLQMYQEAESSAKKAGDSTRARRFSRGIKTLNDLIKQASAGKAVNEEDIPPAVAISIASKPVEPVVPASESQTSTPTRPAPPPPRQTLPEPVRSALPPPDVVSISVTVNNDLLNTLTSRRDEYKRAALAAKKEGDIDTAMKFVKVSRQFDPVIAAVEAGQEVDVSQMPPPLGGSVIAAPVMPAPVTHMEQAANQTSTEEATEEDLFPAPPAPATVKEALEQRLAKYRSVQAAAQDEGNSSKARRIGRIVKQYEDALKLHRAGKPVPVEDLPTPPGFGPIPQEGGSSIALPVPAPAARAPSPAPLPSPSTVRSPAPAPPPRPVTTLPLTPVVQPDVVPQKANVRKSPQSRQEKQLALLTARQKEFKEAALEAKRNGEINQAKEYLRLAKGFDPLIEASENGLPVDMDTVPVPPGVNVSFETDFDIILAEDCMAGSDSEIFEKLEGDLLKQAKMCLTTRDHFKAVGDVASANRFEQLALHSKKDLDTLRFAHRRSEPVPKFHYETKTFSIVQCCTELGDNDLELTIVQGINYTVPNPKDVDTYVKFEFPYPSEEPPKDRTVLVKDTNNPEYNAVFPLQIHRSSRACQRVFKRHSIKLEVWSRGSVLQSVRRICCLEAESNDRAVKSGFLRSDTLIGTALVKLIPLETKCILHDAFDLLDGRRPVGGKLEVKVRLRNPMVTKQIEQITEKWLIIGKL